MLFKIVANQIECSKHEQRSVIKFLVTNKCKSCKTAKEYMMCMEKHVLVKKCLKRR